MQYPGERRAEAGGEIAFIGTPCSEAALFDSVHAFERFAPPSCHADVANALAHDHG